MKRALVLALVFLTRVPIPVRFTPEPADWGRSVVCFPLVGLFIGFLLLILYGLLGSIADGVAAVLLLTVWVLLTGALHLDGLADAADAWVGGLGDRERSLAIMKDPRSGPFAIVMVVLVLLGKFAALQALIEQGDWRAILLAPVLGRAAILGILLTTPYVRHRGVGAAHADHLPHASCRLALLGIVILVALLEGWRGLLTLMALGLALCGFRSLLITRLGGATGDTLGAACELTEVAGLLLAVIAAC